MANFQFIPYTLIAVGLINAVYRHNESGALSKSYLLVIVGALLFFARRIKSLQISMEKRSFRVSVMIIVAFLVLFTLI